MKKLTVVFSSIICSIIALFSFTACDFFATDPDGRSPYDVAVDNGYQGSLDNWLAGADGATTPQKLWFEEYTKAKEAGEFTGTFPEFLIAVQAEGSVVANTALRSVVRVTVDNTVGSGVIYSLDKERGDAYVITNYHVVEAAVSATVGKAIDVWLYGSDVRVPAQYFGGAMTCDLAVLKVADADPLKGEECFACAATAANSDAVTVGETAYVVGNAVGMGLTVTRGIVSVAYEEIETFAVDGKTRITLPEIRVDAAVNHGNSGGGLFNARGELIGIVNARLEELGGDVVFGIGYALPANFALALTENMIDNQGTARVARLDMKWEAKDSRIVFDEATGKLFTEEKILLTATESMNGAGYMGGLRNGDTLISGKIVHPPQDEGGQAREEREVQFTLGFKLNNYLLNVRRNDTLIVTVSRAGEEVTCTLEFTMSAYFSTIA